FATPPSPGSEGFDRTAAHSEDHGEDVERAGEQAGEVDALTASAPERVWLQVDTDGDPDDRSALLPREAWDGLSWCWESIGGQEVTYIREDLHASALAQARAERDALREALGRILENEASDWK